MHRALPALALASLFLQAPDVDARSNRPLVRLKSWGKRLLGTARARFAPIKVLDREIAKIDFGANNRAPRLSQRQARRLLARASEKLGVEFRLDWNRRSSSIFADKGKPVVVPRGLVRKAGMTEDGLALILAHEAAHMKGTKAESKADYWAARRGLRKLWGKEAFRGGIPVRALLAAHSALAAMHAGEAFNATSGRRPKLELFVTGYPTLQSRWDIYKMAALGRRMPRVSKRHAGGEPELMSRPQAARFLGVTEKELARRAKQKGGPVELRARSEVQYIKQDLERFLGR